MTTDTRKICVVCQNDCSDVPRVKDDEGNYYCRPCYEQQVSKEKFRMQLPAESAPSVGGRTSGKTAGATLSKPQPRTPSVAAVSSASPRRRTGSEGSGGESFFQNSKGHVTVGAGAILLLIVLSHLNQAFGLIYFFVAVGLLFGVGIATLVCAFKTSIVQGLLTFFVPFYFLYFVFGVSDSAKLKTFMIVNIIGWLGIFFLPGAEIQAA